MEKHLRVIWDKLSHAGCLYVVSPTGTGKSTIIPYWFAAQGAKTFVAVPARISAVSLCRYSEMQISTGSYKKAIKVGYAANRDINYKANTDLVYVTVGHLKHKLLKLVDKGVFSDVTFADIVIVDESHSSLLDLLRLCTEDRTKSMQIMLNNLCLLHSIFTCM